MPTLNELIESGVTRFCRDGWHRDKYVELRADRKSLDYGAWLGGEIVTMIDDLSQQGWKEFAPEFRLRVRVTVRGQTWDDILAVAQEVCRKLEEEDPDTATFDLDRTSAGEFFYDVWDAQRGRNGR
ncbi:MAG: hypothetical protein PVF45_06120 [Anaerolineae bacterium]|jgi:hypothetical protein